MATPAGTRAFLQRAAQRLAARGAAAHGEALPQPPRSLGDLLVTPFGFGAYRLVRLPPAHGGS